MFDVIYCSFYFLNCGGFLNFLKFFLSLVIMTYFYLENQGLKVGGGQIKSHLFTAIFQAYVVW